MAFPVPRFSCPCWFVSFLLQARLLEAAMEVKSFVKYPNSTGGTLAPQGSMTVTQGTKSIPSQVLTWDLHYTDDACPTNGASSMQCTTAIYSGTDCSSDSAIGVPSYNVAQNPWHYPQVKYNSTLHVALGGVEVVTGLLSSEVLGHAMVIHSSAILGGKVACGIISEVAPAATCFPGATTVQVHGRGGMPISTLRENDLVLVKQNTVGNFAYEPVIGFLHNIRGGRNQFLTVSHLRGEFQASESHMIFVATGGDRPSKAVGDLQIGDRIFAMDENGVETSSAVLSVRRGVTRQGMFSPITPSGTLVADNVVASIYGKPSMHVELSHGAVHASFFPLRAYHWFSVRSLLAPLWAALWAKNSAIEAPHPFVLMLRRIRS